MATEAQRVAGDAGEVGLGARVIALAEQLAQWSETADGLTCSYMSGAHRAVAAELRELMRVAGMTAEIDGVGNVVGRYAAADPAAKALIVASHYDTVLDAGKYDGRLGILAGLVAVEELRRRAVTLPFHVDVIGFSEEEGVRFSAPYIGSKAVAGRFDADLLQRRDAGGESVADVIQQAGFDPEKIPSLARRAADLIGYLEVHIEQGPVLLQENLPVGIVTSIAGSSRYAVTVEGAAGHAGTVPMALRRDAAAAAAEIVLYVERRCAAAPTLVGTVGRLAVPGGAINVIPGRCELSLDIRAGDDATRDTAVVDVLAEIARIGKRRQVAIEVKEIQRGAAVPCTDALQARLAAAVRRAGIAPRFLPSGAGHDAVSFAGITDIAMLFVRCGNGGISHSPLETITADDADLAVRVLIDVLLNFEASREAG